MNRPNRASEGSVDEGPIGFLREQVRKQPQPPRPVPSGALLKRVLTRRESLIMMGLGAADLLFVAGWIGWTDPVGPARWGVAGLCVMVGLAMLATPALFYRRLRYALRHGLVREATIHELQFQPAEDADATLAATRHGFAWGMRVVEHPRGHFEDEFECDAPWAPVLEPGTIVRVLVHPTRKKTLLALGPRNDSRPSGSGIG